MLEVLRMETCVVEGERERALVKRAHIMPLKRRLSAKKIWWGCKWVARIKGRRQERVEGGGMGKMGDGGRTARITNSKTFSPFSRPIMLARNVAKFVVTSVVVL